MPVEIPPDWEIECTWQTVETALHIAVVDKNIGHEAILNENFQRKNVEKESKLSDCRVRMVILK